MTNTSAGSLGVETQEVPGHPIVSERQAQPCVVVIFGATGDLTRRKLVPALYNLMADGVLPDPIGVVGFARGRLSAAGSRARLQESTAQFSRPTPLHPRTW